jgi:hypothetical protein
MVSPAPAGNCKACASHAGSAAIRGSTVRGSGSRPGAGRASRTRKSRADARVEQALGWRRHAVARALIAERYDPGEVAALVRVVAGL